MVCMVTTVRNSAPTDYPARAAHYRAQCVLYRSRGDVDMVALCEGYAHRCDELAVIHGRQRFGSAS
ncbi:Uncharacterised protein [Mycobacteroides abscessus subsp. abscessus]|nr:Uncharacterised protein [Mycobacteroides abscessus subsp. abscessus]